jgi:hypothetical protein
MHVSKCYWICSEWCVYLNTVLQVCWVWGSHSDAVKSSIIWSLLQCIQVAVHTHFRLTYSFLTYSSLLTAYFWPWKWRLHIPLKCQTHMALHPNIINTVPSDLTSFITHISLNPLCTKQELCRQSVINEDLQSSTKHRLSCTLWFQQYRSFPGTYLYGLL